MFDRHPTNYIERDATNIIKGIALILMFTLHIITPELVDSFPISVELFTKYFRSPLNGCVCIFAFLTGYFYVFNKQKNFRYSIRKATDLWLTYIFYFAIALTVSISLGCYDFSIGKLILELIGLYNQTVSVFCWYVDFYIVSMFLLPVLYVIVRKNALVSFVIGYFIPALAVGLYHGHPGLLNNDYLDTFFHAFFVWFPCVFIGVFFAEYQLFQRVYDKLFINPFHNKVVQVVLLTIVAVFAFMGRYFSPAFNYIISFSMDIVYTPLFIYCIVNILYIIPKYKKYLYPIWIIGKYSLPMWFLHGLFFNSSKQYTQMILYWPGNGVLVLLWALLICLLGSIVFMKPVKWLINKKNSLAIFR